MDICGISTMCKSFPNKNRWISIISPQTPHYPRAISRHSYGKPSCLQFFPIYTIPSGYDSHSHGKIHPFLIGKPSISMPWLNHGYVSHSQRVLLMNHFPKLCWIKLLINGYTTNMNVIPPKFTVKSLFLTPLKSTSSGEPPWGSWVAGSPVQE